MPATSNLAIDSLPLAFGIIMAIIGLVFYTQGLPGKFWRRFLCRIARDCSVLFYTRDAQQLRGVCRRCGLANLWLYSYLSIASQFAAHDLVDGRSQDTWLGLESDCDVFRCQYRHCHQWPDEFGCGQMGVAPDVYR